MKKEIRDLQVNDGVIVHYKTHSSLSFVERLMDEHILVGGVRYGRASGRSDDKKLAPSWLEVMQDPDVDELRVIGETKTRVKRLRQLFEKMHPDSNEAREQINRLYEVADQMGAFRLI